MLTKWNTKRLYARDGQPLVAQLRDDGTIIFADMARMLWGVITDGKPEYDANGVTNVARFSSENFDSRYATREERLQEITLSRYDHGHYAGHDDDARALYMREVREERA